MLATHISTYLTKTYFPTILKEQLLWNLLSGVNDNDTGPEDVICA